MSEYKNIGNITDIAPPLSIIAGIPVISNNETQLDKKLGPKVINILMSVGKVLHYFSPSSKTFNTETRSVQENMVGVYSKKSIPPYEINLEYVDGKTIRQGDLMTGIAGKDLEFTPEEGMRVLIDGDVWNIVSIEPIYTGILVALYLFQLRRKTGE